MARTVKDLEDWLLLWLEVTCQLMGVERRALERALGVSGGYLTHLFEGRIRFRLDHLLAILKEIDVHPHTFLAICFPRRAVALSSTERRLQQLLGVVPFPEELDCEEDWETWLPTELPGTIQVSQHLERLLRSSRRGARAALPADDRSDTRSSRSKTV